VFERPLHEATQSWFVFHLKDRFSADRQLGRALGSNGWHNAPSASGR
jgi:hypothetical protein